MTHWRSIILWGVALLVLITVNVMIVQKERLIAQGVTIFLELAPVDPRSLIQGDYMQLRYALADDVQGTDFANRDTDFADRRADFADHGVVVIQLDEQRIATFVRLHDPQQPLSADEQLLTYHQRGRNLYFGPDAFFFQEGHALYYEDATYAELRVSDTGESVLIGLRGAKLEELVPEE